MVRLVLKPFVFKKISQQIDRTPHSLLVSSRPTGFRKLTRKWLVNSMWRGHVLLVHLLLPCLQFTSLPLPYKGTSLVKSLYPLLCCLFLAVCVCAQQLTSLRVCACLLTPCVYLLTPRTCRLDTKGLCFSVFSACVTILEYWTPHSGHWLSCIAVFVRLCLL